MEALLKKIGRIAFKILIGILVFVFFVIYIVIPLGAPWAIRSQGSKILAHPVRVRSVWLNPFLLRLSIDGLKILGVDKNEVLIGFDKFWVDASFLSLFKKEYRIESIGLSGLVVNAALLPGNKINLMDLVPAQSHPASAQPAKPALPPSLPNARIDSIALTNGIVTFTDRTLSPQFTTKLDALTLTVTGISTKPESIAHAVFSTKIDDKGLISSEANFKPLAQPIELESTFSLNDYALTVLEPYVGKYTGRSVKTGKMDLRMDYKISNNQLNARHKLLIQKFDFGGKVESKDALHLPFGLAVALLEDPQGRIAISLPVKGDMSSPKFEYWHLVGQVVTNFFMKLITSPFLSLISMGGGDSGTEELGTISFDPGKSELTDKTKEKLTLFVKVLKERPKLSLEVNGSYDPKEDWKAIRTEAYTTEFTDRRKQSDRSDFRIIKDMYILRFGIRDSWELAKKFTSDKKIDELSMQQEMKRLIIDQGKVDRVVLELLAQQRAKAVYDFIIAGGFDSARAEVGNIQETQASMGQIPLEFTITVFEGKK
jgi:outer membrane protein OmpA-like peptidoglycan-associated protein